MTGGQIAWKVVIALVATFFSLCSACGFMFSLGGRDLWSISVPCFLLFGGLAFLLWKYFTRIGNEKPTRLDING
jgi:hypothetical protein